MKISTWKMLLTASLFALLFNGCTTSTIMPSNPKFAKADAKDFAMVYVMRPKLQRTRGIADNDLTIEFGEKQLVSLLSAGEYVAFKVRPGPLDIITRNETYITTKPDPVDVWRARNFTFDAGATYFIEAKFTQEEFRGIYFIAQQVDLKTAKSFIHRLKPAGDLAKEKPLTSL